MNHGLDSWSGFVISYCSARVNVCVVSCCNAGGISCVLSRCKAGGISCARSRCKAGVHISDLGPCNGVVVTDDSAAGKLSITTSV